AVKKRLERGRERLRAVLLRRGFGPAVVLAIGSVPASAVPARLLEVAPRLAAGVAPPTVLRLAEGVVSMTFAKLGAAATLVAAVGIAIAAGPDDPARRPAAAPPPVDRPKATVSKENPTDPDALAGEWTVSWIETRGEALYDAKTRDEFSPPPKVVFRGDRAEVKDLIVLFVRDFSFKLDPGKAPKELDATFLDGPMKGKTFAGIYTLRGDELRICLRLQGTQLGRPKGFVTNSGNTLYTFILTRRATPAAVGVKPAPAVRPESVPAFDDTLRAGNKLYFVLDRPQGEDFRKQLAAVGARLETAVRTADRVRDVVLKGAEPTVIFFLRSHPTAKTGSHTGFTRNRLREIVAVSVDQRADELLEHAWTLGRLPADAVPVPPEPPPPARVDPPPPPGVPASGAKTDAPVLTVPELAKLVTGAGGNPGRAYGREVEFTGTVISVGKGLDGGTVPSVRIEGWPGGNNLYDRVYVHNVFPDRVGKAGDRVQVRGRIVSHGYGTLFLWCDQWVRQEAGAAAPPLKVEGIYDRVHSKADLPGPGTEVPSPKDRTLVYYHTNTQRMWGGPGNAGKHPGLYASRDGGKTWKLLNSSFEFERLFVHPATGHLFAVIDHTWLATEAKDGPIQRLHAEKAVTSSDGGTWKDITPSPGYVADILDIFADPDHPGRVCLYANIIRDYILRPKDDRYTDWDWIPAAHQGGRLLLERCRAALTPP
ncbi:MAG TPA: TIGR03067 domain-containing protein, partial [Urbifossiella sp.]|nr:TIGR03067 domain-containing protein [Urbifossiella sp.]